MKVVVTGGEVQTAVKRYLSLKLTGKPTIVCVDETPDIEVDIEFQD